MNLLKFLNFTSIESEIENYETYVHVASLFILLIIFAAYLWFVLIAGPDFMSKREPYNVKHLLRIYNIVQVVICSIYVSRAYELGFTFKYIFKCEKFTFLNIDERSEVTIGAWLFLMLRVFEFNETVFFVLRKKQSQASFLHIFHHIGSVLMTWLFLVSHAELMAVYIAIINSFVHIIMYTYYFLSSYKHEFIQKIIKKVKPFITILQLVQFVIIIAHCIVSSLPSCHASYFFEVQIGNFIILFFLFTKFFIESYLNKSKNISS